jgi:hypothetical protein
MTPAQATADVFWIAFRSMSLRERRAFLERLSDDEESWELLEDLHYGAIADERKQEPKRPLSAILRENQ